MLYVGKMPDEVTAALLETHKEMKEAGCVEENPNGVFDPESPDGNNYRNVVPYLIENKSHVAYTYLSDLGKMYGSETKVRWDTMDLITIMDYPVGGKYDDHTDWSLTDGSASISSYEPFAGYRKISFVAQLSEPESYQGGNMRIWLDGKALILPKDKGTICAFPSFNLHGVEPITKGNRISMVSWVLGNENWI